MGGAGGGAGTSPDAGPAAPGSDARPRMVGEAPPTPELCGELGYGQPTLVASSRTRVVVAAVRIVLLDATTLDPQGTLPELVGPAQALALAPAGDLVAVSLKSRPDEIELWSTVERKRRQVLKGHTKSVRSLAFTPTGDRLISGSEDTSVRVWSMADGSTLRTLAGHTSPVEDLAATSTLVASGEYRGEVRLWNLATGALVFSSPYEGSSDPAVAFSPSGSRLFIAHGPSLSLHDVTGTGVPARESASGAIKYLLPTGESSVLAITDASGNTAEAISVPRGFDAPRVSLGFETWAWAPRPGGTQGLLVVDRAGPIKVLSAQARVERQVTLAAHFAASAATWGEGRTLALGLVDGAIQIIDGMERKAGLRFAALAKTTTGIAFRSDGRSLIAGGLDGAVRSFDAQSGRETGFFNAQRPVRSLALSPDGRLLAVGLEDRSAGGHVVLLDGESLVMRKKLPGPGPGLVVFPTHVNAVRFSPDGKTLAAAFSASNALRVWDLGQDSIRWRQESDASWAAISDIDFHPQSPELAYALWTSVGAGFLSSVGLLSADTGSVIGVRFMLRDRTQVIRLAYAFGGRGLLVGDADGGLDLYHAGSGRRMAELPPHAHAISGLISTPSGFVSASSDGTVRFWCTTP